jgi:hypothetical protein
MNEGESMSKIAITLLAVACLLPTTLSLQAKAQKESYTAMLATNNAGASQVRFNFTITKYATDDEVKQLATILKDQGQDALVEALKKLDAGRINKIGDTGNQIAIAEKAQSGNGTVITIITARRIAVSELQRSAKHTDYPLGYMTVTLNEKGEGTGKMMTAAKIKFDEKKGHYTLEPYGNGYVPVTNVALSN